MHRLEAVAHVGQRAADDHAHRVIEVRALHLVLDGYGAHIRGQSPGGIFSVGQGLIPVQFYFG